MKRPFVDILMDIGNGVTNQTLTDELAKVVHAVGNTFKDGELTLKLKVSAEGDGKYTLVPTISSKIPTLKVSSIFWGTPEGSLTRNDPSQDDWVGDRGSNIHNMRKDQ